MGRYYSDPFPSAEGRQLRHRSFALGGGESLMPNVGDTPRVARGSFCVADLAQYTARHTTTRPLVSTRVRGRSIKKTREARSLHSSTHSFFTNSGDLQSLAESCTQQASHLDDGIVSTPLDEDSDSAPSSSPESSSVLRSRCASLVL